MKLVYQDIEKRIANFVRIFFDRLKKLNLVCQDIEKRIANFLRIFFDQLKKANLVCQDRTLKRSSSAVDQAGQVFLVGLAAFS